MKKNGIINAELSHAIATMGHTDIMMVVDAGFPIPADAWRIDLAFIPEFPSTEMVLRAIAKELVVEKTIVADDVPTMNAPLDELVRDAFPVAEHATMPHEELLGEIGKRAKVIVRTGAYNPWGNIALVSGVDLPKWYNKDRVVVPDYYQERIEALRNEEGK